MDRPSIKDSFGDKATLKQVHEAYVNNKELFNYAQSLDNYIDFLEKQLNEKKSNALKVRTDHAFISDVCFSYNHSFGIMPEIERDMLIWQCKEWIASINKNIEHNNLKD
jgi:hypothetical protein